MKIRLRLLIYTFLLLVLIPQKGIFAQVERCAAERLHLEKYQAAEREEPRLQIYAPISTEVSNDLQTISQRSVATLPVVVHVVWHEEEENVSDDQIYSQIEILNADFRAKNCQIPEVLPQFKELIADMELEFCLASIDPDGNPTDGITRTYSVFPFHSNETIFFSSKNGKDGWPSEDYINIWVTNLGSTLGFASFPSNVAPREKEGIVINFKNFGNIGTAIQNRPYHLGRTATHEMGHYFNLLHVFGDDCTEDHDLVGDTPATKRTYSEQCPTEEESSCGTVDMYQNFMHYTDDACMALFTKGQKTRMLNTLINFRASLLQSNKCSSLSGNANFDFTLLPNPTKDIIRLSPKGNTTPSGSIRIFSPSGQILIQEADWPIRQPIPLTGIGHGLFFLELTCGEERWVGRFVKT